MTVTNIKTCQTFKLFNFRTIITATKIVSREMAVLEIFLSTLMMLFNQEQWI